MLWTVFFKENVKKENIVDSIFQGKCCGFVVFKENVVDLIFQGKCCGFIFSKENVVDSYFSRKMLWIRNFQGKCSGPYFQGKCPYSSRKM